VERLRVILAENDADMRLRLCGLLDQVCDVVAALADGGLVVEKAEELHPDLVLLDISMPGMSGFAVARALHRSMPSVPILFVTQHADRAYVEEAFRSGVTGYVLKTNLAGELGLAVQQVHSGASYLSPCLNAK